jgi:hypothetical protein
MDFLWRLEAFSLWNVGPWRRICGKPINGVYAKSNQNDYIETIQVGLNSNKKNDRAHLKHPNRPRIENFHWSRSNKKMFGSIASV